MNAHDKRRRRIIERTKKSTRDLFGDNAVDRIRMDEIAAKASVSKSTLYKYFHSKEKLLKEAINFYVDEILADAEKALDSNLDPVKKLKIVITAKVNSSKADDIQSMYGLLEENAYSDKDARGVLKSRIKSILHLLYEEAIREGYLEEDVSFDLFSLYLEIFQAGFREKSIELKENLIVPELFDRLLHLYIFGILGRK